MDNRLDFYNALNKHAETLTDDDALLVLSHNKKDGDVVVSLIGDWQLLSMLFSVENLVNVPKEKENGYKDARAFILNTAFNICMTDDKIKEQFKNGLL